MAYASSETYLLTRLQKNSVAVRQKRSGNMQVYIIKKIYQKLNVFNVVYQQGIRIVFLFHSKINYCTESNTCAGRICK